MPDFASPLGGLAEGLQGGVNIGLQVEQAQRARKAQEWENDFRIMSAGLNLAQTKGMSPESQAKILNESVAPAWKKWTGQPFPEVGPHNIETVKPLVGNLATLGKQAAEGKLDWNSAFQEANNQIASFHAQTEEAGSVSEKEKAALDAAMAPIKGGYETSQAAAKKVAGETKTPDEVMKEMFDISTKVTGMQQLDQQTANLITIAPEAASQLVGSRLSPEQLGHVQGMAAARMQALNQMLPADRRLQEITPDELKHLRTAGYPTEEIYRKYYVVPHTRK